MAKLDDEDDNEANFLDIQKNLNTYFYMKLRALENMLIDSYHGILKEKDRIIYDLDESEVQGKIGDVSKGKMNPTSQINQDDHVKSQMNGPEPGITSIPLEVQHQVDVSAEETLEEPSTTNQ
ncbi:hypothetical protein HAX54_052911 [Datura stramonium]|uniref:Uncharacterized protein n=1 Tax=Datura stramonium TaxID=4076 RepID=A0ABS8T1G7_DATST|nr:hypothetical protein [Datura stramonium]